MTDDDLVRGMAATPDARATCATCRYFHAGYTLHGMRTPPWCTMHFHSQRSDDLACRDYDTAPNEGGPNV